MGIFDDPDNAIYRATKAGTVALLQAVNQADVAGRKAKDSKDRPCDAVTAYLDASFLGPFLRSGQEIPYAENAGVLGTYIDFLDSELERGASHATHLHQTHLKLLAYVTAIEATAPLSLFGNCLEYLGGGRTEFDWGIYYDLPSATRKLEAVNTAAKPVKSKLPAEFMALHKRLRSLFDATYRNAIAHATYPVWPRGSGVDIWRKGKKVRTLDRTEVDQRYQESRFYLQAFFAGVGDFAEGIHPECPYAWHP